MVCSCSNSSFTTVVDSNHIITIGIYSKELIGKKLLGTAVINMSDVLETELDIVDMWIDLENEPEKHRDKSPKTATGALHVEIEYNKVPLYNTQ